MINRRTILTALSLSPLVLAGRAQAAPEATRVPIELYEEATTLDGAVALKRGIGDVTMVEFFDYNCGWCRQSARDLTPLIEADKDLTYVLVNFAVLGIPSIAASKVALGYRRLYGERRYLELHRRLFALTGTVDGERALRTAIALGADRAKLIAAADGDDITAQLKQAVSVGDNLGLVATPSFLVGPQAYQGHLTLADKRAIIAAVRA